MLTNQIDEQTSRRAIEKKVFDIVSQALGALPPNNLTDLEFDKIDEIEIIMDLEYEYDRNITDEEFKMCKSIDAMTSLIFNKLYR